MVVDVNYFFQKQKHHHKSDKHHHKRDYHKTKGNEVITEQEEIENKHNIKHNQSSQLMMSKFQNYRILKESTEHMYGNSKLGNITWKQSSKHDY